LYVQYHKLLFNGGNFSYFFALPTFDIRACHDTMTTSSTTQGSDIQ